MRHFVLALTLFLFGQQSMAAFSLQKETCTVTATETVTFAIGDDSFSSKVQVDLFFEGSTPLPKLRMTFLEHRPYQASIQFKPIISQRQGAEQFRAEIRDRIRQEDGKPFAFEMVSQPGSVAVYESAPLNLNRAQDFVALFLSQNEFILSALTAQGDEWQAKFPLSASDSSFRQLGAQCFASHTAGYLSASGERVSLPAAAGAGRQSSAAIHWSEGYGLTAFTEVIELLPSSLKASTLLSGDVSNIKDSIDQMTSSLIALATTKRSNQAALATLEANPEYVSLNNRLGESYSTLETFYSRFVAITGNNSASTESLIAQKIKEQTDLQLSISSLAAAIDQKTLAQSQGQQELGTMEQNLAPFLQQLAVFEQNLGARTERIAAIELLVDHLDGLLEQNQQILGDEAAAAHEGAPLSLEQIEEQQALNIERAQKIQTISTVKAGLESVTDELAMVLEAAQAQDLAARDYLGAVSERRDGQIQGVVALQRLLTVEENWLFQSRQVPQFTMATEKFFNSLNDTVEAALVAESANASGARGYDEEFDFHAERYGQVEARFVQELETARKDAGTGLIANILCPPAVLIDSKNRTRPCLTVDEVLDEKLVEAFFAALPAQTIEVFLGSVEKPWSQSVTKTQILNNRFQSEIGNPTAHLQTLVNTWGELRHIIWRWVTMQKEGSALDVCADPAATALFADKVYSAAYYQRVFQCEKAEVAKHEQERSRLIEAIAQVQSTLAEKEAVFRAADLEFERRSKRFVNVSLARIKDVIEQAGLTRQFNACVLPLQSAEVCHTMVVTTVNNTAALLSQEQATYVELARSLVMSINFQTGQLAEETRTLIAESQAITNEKESFMASNNIPAMIAAKSSMEVQLSSLTAEIAQLKLNQSQSEVALNANLTAQDVLKQEAAGLITQIQGVASQVRELLPEFEPFCGAIRPVSETLRSTDEALFALLAPGQPVPAQPLYSSCQMPNLDSYIPQTTALPVQR